MDRSRRSVSRRGLFGTSASPQSASEASFDHRASVSPIMAHATSTPQTAPQARRASGKSLQHAFTFSTPAPNRSQNPKKRSKTTDNYDMLDDAENDDGPRKGGHSLRRRARVDYTFEHIDDDVIVPNSSSAARPRKRKSDIYDPEDIYGSNSKRRGGSVGADTQGSRRRNPARKSTETRLYREAIQDDENDVQDTIEVGVSFSDVDDSDMDDSGHTTPSPDQSLKARQQLSAMKSLEDGPPRSILEVEQNIGTFAEQLAQSPGHIDANDHVTPTPTPHKAEPEASTPTQNTELSGAHLLPELPQQTSDIGGDPVNPAVDYPETPLQPAQEPVSELVSAPIQDPVVSVPVTSPLAIKQEAKDFAVESSSLPPARPFSLDGATDFPDTISEEPRNILAPQPLAVQEEAPAIAEENAPSILDNQPNSTTVHSDGSTKPQDSGDNPILESVNQPDQAISGSAQETSTQVISGTTPGATSTAIQETLPEVASKTAEENFSQSLPDTIPDAMTEVIMDTMTDAAEKNGLNPSLEKVVESDVQFPIEPAPTTTSEHKPETTIPDAAPQVAVEAPQENILDSTVETAAEELSKSIADATQEAIVEPASETLPDVAIEVPPAAAAEAVTEGAPEAIPEATTEAAPDVAPEPAPEKSTETVSKIATQVMLESAPEITIEPVPEATSEPVPESGAEEMTTDAPTEGNEELPIDPLIAPSADIQPMELDSTVKDQPSTESSEKDADIQDEVKESVPETSDAQKAPPLPSKWTRSQPAPLGKWAHLTPYINGEFSEYPEKRVRSDDDGPNEDQTPEDKDADKDGMDLEPMVDDNDDGGDLAIPEAPTPALNTPLRGSPVPDSADLTTFNSPAPAAEDAEDADVSESQELADAKRCYRYRKLRDAEEYITALEKYEEMSTAELYETLEAINVSMIQWQREWNGLSKIVDDYENSLRRRLADSKYESRTRNLHQHGVNYEEPDFAVKGYRAKEREVMNETRFLQGQDRIMAATYGFEYDPHPSKIGKQNPETQQIGIMTRGRSLRNQPRQTVKASEADEVTGKRQRKPVQLFDPATQDVSRSSTPVPTRGRRRRNLNGEDDIPANATLSFDADVQSDADDMAPRRRKRAARQKPGVPSIVEDSAMADDSAIQSESTRSGRRARAKPMMESYSFQDFEDESQPELKQPRRHLLTLKIPKGKNFSEPSSAITDNGDSRPSTASSDSTTHTAESSYSFRPKRQKRFRDDPEESETPSQAPPKKRGKRSGQQATAEDEGTPLPGYPVPDVSQMPSHRKVQKIKVVRAHPESRNGTPTSQPNVDEGDEPRKDYKSMTKSEKMSASMKSRWANGNMAGAVEKRKATLAAKKAAQAAAEQRVGPIAPKPKAKPAKKDAANQALAPDMSQAVPDMGMSFPTN